MFIPLEIKGDIVSATTDQKVWGSNPYGRALGNNSENVLTTFNAKT